MSKKRTGNQNERRRVQGFVIQRQQQFKLAVTCSSLILLPSLIVSVTLLADLGIEAGQLAETAGSSAVMAEVLRSHALRDALVIIGVFLIFSIASIFLSLRLSNHIVGPVERLEAHVKGLIAGDMTARSTLRAGDYLKSLGELLNDLSTKLTEEQRK